MEKITIRLGTTKERSVVIEVKEVMISNHRGIQWKVTTVIRGDNKVTILSDMRPIIIDKSLTSIEKTGTELDNDIFPVSY